MAKIFVYGDYYGRFGTSGADTFYVEGAHTTLVGGAGNDTYNILNDDDDVYDTNIVENSGGGTDTVNYFGYWNDENDAIYLADNVENLNLRLYGNIGYGNALGNVLRADAGDLQLGGEGAVLWGGDGNDTIIGSAYGGDESGDSLYGDGGNDSIDGGGGSDWIYGGDGNDNLSGGNVNIISDPAYAGYGGDDTIYGQAGNDTISGGNVTITGATGYGYHSAYAGEDYLEGGYGDDLILGGNALIRMVGQYGYLYGGEDWLYGDEGNDTIIGGSNVLYGAPTGNDWSYNTVQAGNDTLYGSAGNDVLRGGNSTIVGMGNSIDAYGGYGDFYGMAGNDSMVAGNTLVRMGDGGGYGYGNSNDQNAGSWAGDEMFGGAGNDTMNSGSTTVIGGRGRDFITGSGDVLYGDIYQEDEEDYLEYGGGPGSDSLTDGNDLLEGGAGNDTLYGGYNLFYGDGADYYEGGGNDTIVGGSDTLRGGAGDDTIYGGVDRFHGGEGNDRITAGNESIDGGTGQNVIVNGYAVMYGDDGNDTLTGGNTDDVIYGDYGNDSMLGNAGNDVLHAADDGADFADGGAGDDTVYGSDHGDTVAGGLGDDVLVVNFYYGGSLTVTDTGGEDRIIVHGERAGSFTLAAGIEGLSNHGDFTTLVGNTLDNFIEGDSGQAETILGLAGNDVLDGRWGGDRLVGGAGNDTYTVYQAGDVVVENAAEGNDTVYYYGDAYGGVLADNVENAILGVNVGYGSLRGTSVANLLMGNMYGNVIEGAGGNDTIDGGDGADVLIGGAGDDSYTIRDSRALIVEQAGGGTDTVRIFDVDGYDLSPNIENAILGDAWRDVAYGVTGNASNNRLEGNKWDNDLDGGAGNDTLIGGAGDDYYYVDSTSDVVTEAAGGGADWLTVETTASSGTFTMAANVEYGELIGGAGLNLIGNTLNNTMYGNAGGNAMNGLAGNDAMYGQGGNDSLTGDIGNDLLDGERGNDTMAGGAGNDTYYVDRGDGAGVATGNEDVVTEALASGTDKVFSSVYTYSLGANVENLELTGTARKGFGNGDANTIVGNGQRNLLSGAAGNDSLDGGAADDTLQGGLGDDRLDGGTGVDSMAGGAGNDTYLADSGADVVSEAASEGTDIVLASVNFTLAANVENLTMSGGAFTGTGNTGANVITGTSSGNVLFGDAGNDTLVGNGGDDTLFGGAGNDSMSGGTGDDDYYVNTTLDGVAEGVNWGYDEMIVESLVAGNYVIAANVEDLTLSLNVGEGMSTVAHNVTGNALNNDINGNAGNNSLSGLGGEDTIDGGTGNDVLSGGDGDDDLVGALGNDTMTGDAGDDSLDGGGGNDSMTGGTGDDFYRIDSSSDVVVEALGGGRDEVQVMRIGEGTYTLAANVENLSTSGAGFMELTGNALNNAFDIDSFFGGDVIDGGDGIDSISGYFGGEGSAMLTSFVSGSFNLGVTAGPAYAWVVDAGGMTAATLTGQLYNDADFALAGLGANAVVTLRDLMNNSPGSLLSFDLDDASGGSDKLTLNVGEGVIQNLGLANVETLALNLANSGGSHFNVAGVSSGTLLALSGGVAFGGFELSGIRDVQTFQFQNYAGNTTLGLADGAGIEVWAMDLDNAHINNLSLGSGLETLTLDTRGDPGFTNGGSIVTLTSSNTGLLTILGSQDLELRGAGANTIDGSGMEGDLLLVTSGTTSFTAGTGDDWIHLSSSNVTLNFGANLDGNDYVFDIDNGDTDVLNAEFDGGTVTALYVIGMETANFDVTGNVVLDVSEVSNLGATMTVDVDGTGNVTLDASGDGGGGITTYNAAGLTGSLTFIGGDASVAVTGSAGNDTVNGSSAGDNLNGGAGNDTFVFDDILNGSVDSLSDFVVVDDTIALSLGVFGDVGPLGTLGEAAFESGAGMTAATLATTRIFLNTSTGYMSYDADGSGTVESSVQFAWMSGPPALTEADFVVIS